MKNYLKFKPLTKKEISNAKGGIQIIPIFKCKYGMNCYGLTEGPCPGESNDNYCP